MTVHASPSSAVGAPPYGSQSMVEPLRRVLVHMPGEEYNQENWENWGLAGTPDRDRAIDQHRGFIRVLEDAGVVVEYLGHGSTLHSIATYDSALITNHGALIFRAGREGRRPEQWPMAKRLVELGIPIIGWMTGEARSDAGDTLWLDEQTLLMAHSYRTNMEGIRQARHALDGIAEVVEVELCHWEGEGYVLHLMSMVSLVAHDAALVYKRNMPIRVVRALQEREVRFIEVPDEEWDTLGSNVLALAPGRVVITAGNPVTTGRLRDAGIEVLEFEADEICWRRVSGPTCNTRPLLRRA